jgi:hypothetical protein
MHHHIKSVLACGFAFGRIEQDPSILELGPQVFLLQRERLAKVPVMPMTVQ